MPLPPCGTMGSSRIRILGESRTGGNFRNDGDAASDRPRDCQQISQPEAEVQAAGLAPQIAKYELYRSAVLKRLHDLAQEGGLAGGRTWPPEK
jgi:hypothetical protein